LNSLPNPEIFLLLAVLLAAALPFRGLAFWERPLARLARHRRLAILATIAVPLILRALLLPLYPAPEPRVHDEFSYLLGADTLAHGRLANPQHPFWMHFESFHILVRPAYASAYPLASAAAMALGKMLFGSFWAGVWLATGLMCGAVCWMLQGWLPPRWALLGAALVILRLGVSSYWMNSYWGGSVAAIGGALVVGALPRILRAPHWRPAAIMGAGLAILANSRTFEGMVLGLAVAVPLLVGLRGRRAWRSTIVPLAVLLAITLAGMAYSWARVTGKPWLPPYVLYRASDTLAPHFLWQGLRPQPLYDNADMRNFYVRWELDGYFQAHRSLLLDFARKAVFYWRFYLGPLLTLPLLALPWLWRGRKTRLVLLLAAGFAPALVVQVYHNFHYAAPATGLGFLIVVLAMRRLRLWRWRGRPVGLRMVRCLPPACAAMLLIQIAAGRVADERTVQAGWRWPAPAGMARARVLRGLEAMGGKHLVMVRYSLNHHPGYEWVYNGADIDGSRVVWARELDRESNARLIEYFRDRRIWLVEPDAAAPHPVPYGDAPPRPMAFVAFGAPGIRVLQSAGEIRRRMLAQVAGHEQPPLTCDVWNFYFTEATGIQGPDADRGCYGGNQRSQLVGFDQWFEWFRRQRGY
jgi:hypothetical protein